MLEQTPLRPLSGSRSAPSLAARTPSRLQSTLSTPAGRLLSEQLLVHLHRAERPRQSASAENPQAIPLHASGALGGRPMSNTQLPTIVGGLLRAQRSKFLDRDLAQDNTQERYSKERLLESNFGGRSLTRLVQRAKSLSSLQEAEQQARRESAASSREIATSSKHTADRTASAAQELAAAIARGSPLSYGAAGMMVAPRQPARRPRPRRLEIVAGLQTGPELRSKARDFLASSETLLARRERAEQAAAAKGLAHQPHHHHNHHNHQQSQEGFGTSGLGASGTAASGFGTGGPLGGPQSIPPQGSRPPSRAQTPAQTAAQTAEEAEEERRVLEKYNE